MNLGSTIKMLRRDKGFKQYAFAKICGISPTYLSQIENNAKEPNLSRLRVIAKKLGMPLPVLFFLTLDENDIKPEKKQAFNHLAPSIKAMIEEFFMNSAKAND